MEQNKRSVRYNHQRLALQYLRMNDSFALFMEQGTGKTLPTLDRVLELALSGMCKSALVVAPKATMGAWLRDIENHFSDRDSEVLTSVITVINYDSVWRANKGYNREWDCIILDEAHKIKNRTSNRSKFLLKLALKSKFRYILTGTPIGNGQFENIWAQFAFLFPTLIRGRIASSVFGTYREFENRYCLLNQYFRPYAYRHIDEVQDIIQRYSYRVTKAECLDLPEKLPDEIYDIENKERALYKRLHEESALEEFDMIAPTPLVRMNKLRQVCSGFLITDDEVRELQTEKIAVLDDFLEGWNKKLVIFCEFKYSIRNISKFLTKKKIKFVTLDGEQKDKQIWRKFQSDESIKVIVCQYQSASQGLDLFSADTIIYYEPTLSSNLLDQSRDRIHRIGQNQKCSYIHFLTVGTVEKAIYRALSNYTDFSERMFTEYMTKFTKYGSR